ncbi:arginine deiminase family protein [Serpentinicella sp. ANB-PHB4]|uniref:dimethylarginine dimethylaminohydrolase family protein n=1 Tax=Serpentinicella sp. ANB-PHB4 TaxID=3074076 RepID=UPI002860FEA6|nr:arginine deiminase family protein [Serpentinicella sp. ANB-PHB4]MDR5659036.1 arginine deiminase family protein [Serpentinicella sp. ANB-PHB4]
MKIYCRNDFTTMISCLVASPTHAKIINEYNKFQNTVDKKLLHEQYAKFLDTLREHDVEIYEVDLIDAPYQVFTRDVGFILTDHLFVCNMTDPIRKPELSPFLKFLTKYNIKYYQMKNTIEGGDVIACNSKIFVGQSDRTSSAATKELQEQIDKLNLNYEIIKVVIDKSKIHLDCVFNILDENTCLLSEGVYNPKDIEKHFNTIIKIDNNDLVDLAPNIVNLGNKIVLCSSYSLYEKLQGFGYKSIYIPFTELIKVNGSLGCCIFPLYRK